MDRRKDEMRELEQTVDWCVTGLIGKKIDALAKSTCDIDLVTARKIEETEYNNARWSMRMWPVPQKRRPEILWSIS